jgi:hypothetical protein
LARADSASSIVTIRPSTPRSSTIGL